MEAEAGIQHVFEQVDEVGLAGQLLTRTVIGVAQRFCSGPGEAGDADVLAVGGGGSNFFSKKSEKMEKKRKVPDEKSIKNRYYEPFHK